MGMVNRPTPLPPTSILPTLIPPPSLGWLAMHSGVEFNHTLISEMNNNRQFEYLVFI